MREYLVQKRNEIQVAKLEAEKQKKKEKLDKLASSKHHLVGTVGRSGVCGAKSKSVVGEFLLTDDILWNSSALKAIPNEIKQRAKLVKKVTVVDGPENPEDAKKLAQGPFLVI